MHYVGMRPIVVHGEAEINRLLERLNIPSEFVNGLRSPMPHGSGGNGSGRQGQQGM